MRQLIAVVLFCAGLFCIAQAQVPLTGAGLGAPSGGVAGYTGPGDVVSGAIAWYGLRAYSAATAGNNAADIFCVSANTTNTIKTLANGKFDVATLTADCPADTYHIAKLYDQTGGNNCGAATCDVSQATDVNRPVLTLNCINTSLPCISIASAASSLTLSSANSLSSQAAPYTTSYVALWPDNAAVYAVAGIGSIVSVGGTNNSADQLFQYGGGALNMFATAVHNQQHSVQNIINGASSELYVDGTATSPGNNPGSSAATGTIKIGTDGFGNNLAGKIEEVGFWDVDFSASSNAKASAMCHNQFAYWATATSC